MTDLNQPFVIDNGSGMTKAGFAGGETPSLHFSSFVGRPKLKKVMAGGKGSETDNLVGNQLKDLKGVLKYTYPMKHGIVRDWQAMQHIWQYVYTECKVVQDQHPVLLTEAPLNPKTNRGKCAEIFFENFHVPALYVQMQPILSLYASGRTTGIVLDIGDGVTSVVPTYEGFAIPHAIQRADVGGRDVTEYLQVLLRKNGHPFHTSSEQEVVRDIKEKLCHVSDATETVDKEESDEGDSKYMLPDGHEIQIGAERFRAPELLFDPAIIGLEYEGAHSLLLNSIAKCDMDMRRTLFANVILSGGSTLFDGFGNRMVTEVRNGAPKDAKIKIWAPTDRIFSTWIGGSILASLATFKKMWISRQDWQEHGKSIIYRKTF